MKYKYYSDGVSVLRVFNNEIFALIQGKGWMLWPDPNGIVKESNLITEEKAKDLLKYIIEEF